jgi:hypothetical protein
MNEIEHCMYIKNFQFNYLIMECILTCQFKVNHKSCQKLSTEYRKKENYIGDYSIARYKYEVHMK